MDKKPKYDVVTIGDCTLDAFLEVKEAEVEKTKNGLKLCLSYGDKIPYESLTILSAGNSNNAAVGMARLGLKAGYYGTVGGDHNSHVILNKLHDEGVSREFMSVQKGMQTNFHIDLWYKGDRTILIKHQPYKYELPKGLENTKWIYFSSVGKNGLTIHSKLAAFLNKHQEIKMVFNPGTFQLRTGLSKLKPLLKRTEIFIVNKEEAQLLLNDHKSNIKTLAEHLHKHGPKTVVITDGLNGSYCSAENRLYYIGIYPHKPYESTGAGDAFATGFSAALIYGLPIEEALRWGSRNGASVATKIGPQAGLVKHHEMIKDLNAHKKFRAKVLEK